MGTYRILHVLIQPVLVFDDGTTLGPPTAAEARAIPLADLDGIRAALEADLAVFNAEEVSKAEAVHSAVTVSDAITSTKGK